MKSSGPRAAPCPAGLCVALCCPRTPSGVFNYAILGLHRCKAWVCLGCSGVSYIRSSVGLCVPPLLMPETKLLRWLRLQRRPGANVFDSRSRAQPVASRIITTSDLDSRRLLSLGDLGICHLNMFTRRERCAAKLGSGCSVCLVHVLGAPKGVFKAGDSGGSHRSSQESPG